MSQPDFPKQFISVFYRKPLINLTIDRIERYFKKDEILMVVPEELVNITKKFTGSKNIIVEPARKNTAPAICLAAMHVQKKFGDSIIHIMPADHIIKDNKQFIRCLQFGEKMAAKNLLVTYGIIPDRPETGYGYIKFGEKIAEQGRLQSYCGIGFTEKPTKEKAIIYFKQKKYLWNSGIFTYRISAILNEMKKHIPSVYSGVNEYVRTNNRRYFNSIDAISVDYGVMEKSNRICLIKSTFDWDDVGTWLALDRYFRKDEKNNIVVGDALGLEIKDSIVYTYKVPVRLYGISNVVVVACPRGVLVCRKDRAPDIKRLFSHNSVKNAKRRL